MNAAAAEEAGASVAEVTYEAIAPVYDLYTAHHDYEGWIAELLPLLERRGLRGNRLLDVGCGTGKSFLPMLPRGWEVTGCDISASMLALAQTKVGGEVRLSVADMRELPVFGEFDLVWAIDDAVNYLLGDGELEQALRGMAANLAPDGLLFFDVNTLFAYRTGGTQTHVFELGDGRRLAWQGEGKPDMAPGSICEISMALLPDKGEPIGTHRQRHFPEAEVLTAIEGAGLRCLDVYGQGTDGIPRQPLDEAAHTKAVYVAAR